MGWEIIPKELTTFFPSILTGIIFILGFLLAGVVTDYKESEKIPNDIAASLYSIWQEADFIKNVQNCPSAPGMMIKLKLFIPTLKTEFFLKQNDHLVKLLDALSADVVQLGKEGATPNYLFRMKVEITNLKRIMNRITVIKNTDFIPSVFICIQAITIIFLSVYCLLAIDPWWGGLILVSIFTFVIFAILKLIKDMEDPFEYDGSGYSKSDEVSLGVLDNLQEEFEGKLK
jgi:ABC-type multidrug transport system fused ATPase/permease subunit